jgi:hypothetical protein
VDIGWYVHIDGLRLKVLLNQLVGSFENQLRLVHHQKNLIVKVIKSQKETAMAKKCVVDLGGRKFRQWCDLRLDRAFFRMRDLLSYQVMEYPGWI